MLFNSLVLIATLAGGVAIAEPIRRRSPLVVKESTNVPAAWSRVSKGPADHVIELRMALKQARFDELERQLYEVSDPGHARYGQHLSEDEVRKLVAPKDDTLELVHSWLEESGVDAERLSYTPAKDWIIVSLPVSHIEKLLDTEYSVYRHEDGNEVVRTPQYSLPQHLHEHIDTIQPTNSFFRAKPMKKTVMPFMPDVSDDSPSTFIKEWFENPTVAEVCNTSAVTPTCLRTLYGTIDYEPLVPGLNKVGLNDFLGESNNRSDIHIYLEDYRPEAAEAAYEFQFVSIADGPTYQTLTPALLEAGTDVEGNLDAETILAFDWPTPLTAYTTGGSPPYIPDDFTTSDTNEPYLVWINYVLSQSNSEIPQTISTSYGDDEQTVPYPYASRVCAEFAQLGARGISLIFAAGDEGVGASGYCYSNDGKNTPTFLPAFPASCPYVTTVGATYKFNPEVVAYDGRFDPAFASGGGFSNYFPRPAYQDKVVPEYIASLDGEFAEYYNKSGRGYPDVAAQGVNFTTIWNGSLLLVDGTSASTPTFAGVISLVNDALLASGKPTLGFLNPWLYAGGYETFTDVTMGSAVGCAELGNGLGFPAKVGWDAVSGFGTPYFPKLILALELTPKWGSGGGWGGFWI